MFEIEGKYTNAKIFTDNIEEGALKQVYNICNHIAFKDSQVRIMPDVHKGKGICIGFTAKMGNKVIPNVVGVDIGCGVLCVNLGNMKLKEINLEKLDDFIKNNIPSGFSGYAEKQYELTNYEREICNKIGMNAQKQARKLGTLGGGNHFIEVDVDEANNKYLLIHSGSRNFGYKIAKYWQEKADEEFEDKRQRERQKLINKLKEQNREREIESRLKQFNSQYKVPKQLRYLEGKNKKNYTMDMHIAQLYAETNRLVIGNKIMNYLGMNLNDIGYINTTHNYIGEDEIIRKGAVSANKEEKLIIPLNMKEGALLCEGKGNPDWNFSAPHGAGRKMSRTQAKKEIELEKFKNDMKDIYSTSINKSTLDEAPDAYKNKMHITENLEQTVEIKKVLTPIYNYKDN
ncbi:MAG: RtcB family protein [Candidatus Woesearchaeota archaeon]